MIKFSNAVT